MRAYSIDLREKVISHYKIFGKKSETAIIFGIHQDTLNNWLEKLREGSLAAFKTGPKGFKKVDPDEVRAVIKEKPDMTLEELGAMFKVSHVAIWKILRKQGFVYKKNFIVQRTQRRGEDGVSEYHSRYKSASLSVH